MTLERDGVADIVFKDHKRDVVAKVECMRRADISYCDCRRAGVCSRRIERETRRSQTRGSRGRW
jgi:hypothetical protein